MFISLIFIILLAWLSITWSDLGSESTFEAVVMPLVAVGAVTALAVWLVVFLHRRGASPGGRSGGVSGLDSGDFGGGGD